MNWMDSILLLRNELMLVVLLLVLIIAEIFSDDQKKGITNIAIFSMLFITVVGFLPGNYGNLFGNMFVSGEMTGLMKNILNIGTLIVFLQSADWVSKIENKVRTTEYFALMVSTLIGMNFLISSGDFLMFFIGLELATLPLAALASFEVGKSRSAEAGVKMIMSSAFSSAISLMGISIIYAIAGTTYFDLLHIEDVGNPLYVLAFLFFFSGLAFKISIVPYHFWTADVYEGAPINVTSYFSVMSKSAAFFILLILFYKVFQSSIEIWKPLIYITSIATMTIGNLFALRQKNIKRFLAFSSIAQAGFILLGLYSSNSTGFTATVYFILIYLFSNLGAFGVVSILSNETGKENIEDYNGLYKTNPKLSLVMLLSLFSLAGIPPLAGFFGKLFLFASAASVGSYVLVLIATLNATLSLYYYLIVVKAMFISPNDNPIPKISSGNYAKIALVICVLGLILIGFASNIHDGIQVMTENFI